MATQSTCLRTLIVSVAGIALLCLTSVSDGQDRNSQVPQRLREPVFRVAKTPAPAADRAVNAHPLDPAIKVARDCLANIQANVNDYTCTLVKRERINGKLGDYEYMYTKIRNQRMANGTAALLRRERGGETGAESTRDPWLRMNGP